MDCTHGNTKGRCQHCLEGVAETFRAWLKVGKSPTYRRAIKAALGEVESILPEED